MVSKVVRSEQTVREYERLIARERDSAREVWDSLTDEEKAWADRILSEQQ